MEDFFIKLYRPSVGIWIDVLIWPQSWFRLWAIGVFSERAKGATV
jgi:hypothetical protein